jgi:hypothetical protein
MWMALQVSAEVRLRGEEDASRRRRSEALYLAIGGANEALAHLGQESGLSGNLGGNAADDWLPDGYAQVVGYGTGSATVWIEDENNKVNVNKADPSQLKAVLLRAGINEDNSVVLADMIADFIDPDDTPRLYGAEREQYKKMGLPSYLPFNSDLTAVEQLLLVPGVTSGLLYGLELESGEGKGAVKGKGAGGGNVLDPMLPKKNSLFELFTVYGNNTALKTDGSENGLNGLKSSLRGTSNAGGNDIALRPPEAGKDAGSSDAGNTPQWASGEIYRIVSCGRVLTGPPSVILYLIVQYTPGNGSGYQVLYRKIL